MDITKFLHKLSANQLAKSVSFESHLNWLVEMPAYFENVMEYFEYIKTDHYLSEKKEVVVVEKEKEEKEEA